MTRIRNNIVGIGAVACAMLAASPALAGCNASGFAYIGSICQVGFTFCPRGHAEADGQLLAISQFTAMFSLYGTTYGGDGRTTFAFPDLRGRKMVHVGSGPGLNPVLLGQRVGAEAATLALTNLPVHNHAATTAVTATLRGSPSTSGNQSTTAGNVPAATRDRGRPPYPYGSGVANVDMGPSAIAATAATTTADTGAGQSFGIRDPYLGIRHCIVYEGVYPPRD